MVIIKCIIILIFAIQCNGSKITDSHYWIGTTTSSGIGFANTAKTNSSDSLFYNPAGLGTLKESSVNISYSSLYNTDFSSLNFVAHHKLISFGIGVQLNQSTDIEETIYDEITNTITQIGTYNYSYSTLFFSAAMKLPFISFGHIGSTLHVHRMSIDNDALVGESLNVGLILTPTNFLSIGYNHYNIVPLYLRWNHKNGMDSTRITTIHEESSYSAIGIEITPIQSESMRWDILADLELDINDESIAEDTTSNYSALKLGSEFKWRFITLRGGYNYRQTSMGVSTRLNNFQINYTFILPTETEYLDNRHAFGINLFL